MGGVAVKAAARRRLLLLLLLRTRMRGGGGRASVSHVLVVCGDLLRGGGRMRLRRRRLRRRLRLLLLRWRRLAMHVQVDQSLRRLRGAGATRGPEGGRAEGGGRVSDEMVGSKEEPESGRGRG